MGGERALRQTRYLRFDFIDQDGGQEVLHRSHTWDRKTGRYRLEGETAGEPYLVLFNVKTRQGKAFVGNKPEPAKNSQQLVNEAYTHFVGDSFWLLAGLRLREKGTHLEFVDEREISGKKVSTLSLTFDPEDGQNPTDRFWLYVDEATDLPYAWAIQSAGQSGTPVTFLWTNWQMTGKLKLPIRFEQAGGTQAILIDHLFAPATVTDNVFQSVSEPTVRKVHLKVQQKPSGAGPGRQK